MDTCSRNSQTWQFNIPAILKNIKGEIQAASYENGTCIQPAPKEFTTEAAIMIFIILLFVVLTVIGSTISAIGMFCGNFENNRYPGIVRKEMNGTDRFKHAEVEKKSKHFSMSTVAWENCNHFLDCFSIQKNSKRLLSTNTNSEERLNFIHGIRALGTIWVSVIHIALIYASVLRSFNEEFVSDLKRPRCQLLTNGSFANDVFFVLSGFLSSFKFFDYYKKRKGDVSWALFYVNRFLRFTPFYLIVLGFYATLFSYVGSGPTWPTYKTNPVCRENWIWNIFYLNNFLPHMKQCMTVTWFIACDFQLYVTSPLFLLLLVRRPKTGYVFILICICLSCLLSFWLTLKFNLTDGAPRLAFRHPNLEEIRRQYWEYFDVIHIKPYTRTISYLVGTTLGYVVYKRQFNRFKKENLVTLCVGWVVCLIFLWFSFFALHNKEESLFERAVYNGIKFLFFSCSISWIYFVCVTGQGGMLNRFLSLKIFVPVSRLSCSAYFIHMFVIEWYFLSLNRLLDYSLLPLILLQAELICWILAASFAVSLIFERPLLNLLGFFLGNPKQIQGQKKI